MNWKSVLAKLPAGLTHGEVARRVGSSYGAARTASLKHGYLSLDGRSYGQLNRLKFDTAKADWSKSNVVLSREFKVSRELVRLRRKQLGKEFVESRGRKLKYFKPGPPNKHPLRFEFPTRKPQTKNHAKTTRKRLMR